MTTIRHVLFGWLRVWPRVASLVAMSVIATALSPRGASAHAPRQGYMFLRLHTDSAIVRLELNLSDLEEVLSLGWDPKRRPSRDEVTRQLAAIRGYAEEHFALSGAGAPIAPRYRSFDFRSADGSEYLLLEYFVDRELPKQVTITLTPFFEVEEQHRNMLVIEHDWRAGTLYNEGIVSLVYSRDEPTQTLDLSKSTLLRGFVAMVRQGVLHIWIGIDHILFLIALILPAVLMRREGRWEPVDRFGAAMMKIVKIVTFFTLAHTVTLSLAALGVVELPSRLVESVIAVSIAVAALHNLWPVARVNEAAIAFVFGLFHGFGFATVLGDLGLGNEHLALSLLGFNLGVEIGQVAIIAAVFPVLFLARRLRIYNFVLRTGSVALIAIGLLWAAERSLEFNVPLIPIAKSVLGIRADSSAA